LHVTPTPPLSTLSLPSDSSLSINNNNINKITSNNGAATDDSLELSSSAESPISSSPSSCPPSPSSSSPSSCHEEPSSSSTNNKSDNCDGGDGDGDDDDTTNITNLHAATNNISGSDDDDDDDVSDQSIASSSMLSLGPSLGLSLSSYRPLINPPPLFVDRQNNPPSSHAQAGHYNGTIDTAIGSDDSYITVNVDEFDEDNINHNGMLLLGQQMVEFLDHIEYDQNAHTIASPNPSHV
jgi:hypothetical protein